MKKPIIVGLEKKDSNPFPLIELCGPIDIGKKYVGQLLAKRIHGHYVGFPIVGAMGPANRILIKALLTDTNNLEKNLYWWAHIYIASLYESAHFIENLNKEMPVIVSNWTNSFRTWFGSCGLNMPHFYNGFTADLPKPTKVYVLDGENWADTQGNLVATFNPELVQHINSSFRSLHRMGGPKKISLYDKDKFRHIAINKAVDTIVRDLKQYYKIVVNPSMNYTIKSFPPKL